ncbi:MAG: methyltransferase domain-containing protein [Cyclobacteriaceae bacterium]
MKAFILNHLKKQSFQPNFLSIFVNPFFFLRKGLHKHIKKNSHHLSGILLDFGCGRKPYRNLIRVDKYIGVDIAVSGHSHTNSEIDVFYDGKTIPFPDETFDSFLCSEVFEHLFNLEQIIQEINRVTKTGGRGLITVPFAWPEHEVPYDYARYTSFAMRTILEKKGFHILSLEKNGHFLECIIQLSTLYVYTLFHTKNKIWNTLCTLILITPLNIIGFCIAAIFPKRQDLFHNLIIVVEKQR